MNVDLCDESGTMLRLQELKPHESAMSRLEARKTYNLMSIECKFLPFVSTILHFCVNNLLKRTFRSSPPPLLAGLSRL